MQMICCFVADAYAWSLDKPAAMIVGGDWLKGGGGVCCDWQEPVNDMQIVDDLPMLFVRVVNVVVVVVVGVY